MAQAGGGQQQDNSLGPLWIVLALCIVGGIIWHFLHTQIVFVFLKIKAIELSVIGFFTSSVDSVRRFIAVVSPSTVTLDQAHWVASAVGKYIAIPCLLIMLILAFFIYKSAKAAAFRQSYEMKTLAKAQADVWPQIQPVISLDLVKQDIGKGPWAMALTPMDFAKQKKLIIEEEVMPSEDELLRHKRIIAKLDKGKANALFILQLGRPWLGYKSLPYHLQALFGAFAAKANGDRDAAYALLAELSSSYNQLENRVSCANPLALCQKYENTKGVKAVINAHAYELTVMASMLELARYDGVLSSSDFLWLKPVDRKAWFMLNAVGRRTPVPEAAGIFAHWLAEKELGRKSSLPRIDPATQALELALNDVVYHRDDTEHDV